MCEDLVCDEVQCIGFPINSRIRPYVSNRPDLLRCQVTLREADYGFLHYDSYLDCAHTRRFSTDELVVCVGQVTDEDKAQVRSVIAQATTIEPRYKDLILSD